MSISVDLRSVSLSDRFDLSCSSVFLTGNQAILRLLLLQKFLDSSTGLSTAGYITGYRGSPLSGLDTALWKENDLLRSNDIVFEPALNEDLGATALWGTQQTHLHGESRYDGVFGVWYGKGPGVDRTGDVFRHANLAGTSASGGVLVLMGDDHTAESSTTAHQSEFHLLDYGLPIFSPAGVQELLDYGIHGFALSRFAGVWVGMKCVKDTIESTAVVDGSVNRVSPIIPASNSITDDGVHIRLNDAVLTQEERLHESKLPAILDYLRANELNRIIYDGGSDAKLGIISAGKSYLDVCQALDDLGIDESRARSLGIRLYKLGCTWPIPVDDIRSFASGLSGIIVVEEKRSLIESQVRESLYGVSAPPFILGKKDKNGDWLFPIKGALDAGMIAPIIGDTLLALDSDSSISERVSELRQAQESLLTGESVAQRVPYFCAGCPHNSSTIIPSGSRAYAGIGCHYMVQWMDRDTMGYTHMGGEGANWLGEHHFSTRSHIFQNLGDGTYNHSGLMAIRASAISGANITYKILFNDAVAMTGGQPNDGGLTPYSIAHQVSSVGANRIAIVTDEPNKYGSDLRWPSGTTIHHRRDILSIQNELSAISGLTILIYDQTCAAEKRRRRKRGEFPDPPRRVVINSRVCESCGDCGLQSNCVAIGAVSTPFGRKREIDQSSCNKDFSCLDGFCPSFVTVHGAQLKSGSRALGFSVDLPSVPSPPLPELDSPYGIIITGVGGTGVVTIGAIMGMAAHLDGKGSAVLDMAGLAQKGGEVLSHLRIAPDAESITAVRISSGGADLILACDMVGASTQKVLGCISRGRTRIVVNDHEQLSGDFTRDVDFSFPTRRILQRLEQSCSQGHYHCVESHRLALALLGDAIASNMFMLGFAWQSGTVPLSEASILRAIELNGVQVEMNQAAFGWGRVAAHDISLLPNPKSPDSSVVADESLTSMIDYRADELHCYQNESYASRYRHWLERISAAERHCSDDDSLSRLVMHNLFKLMAIKDEYEVARLFTNGHFESQLKSQFERWDSLEFHLAPPLFAKRDSSGNLLKSSFGGWIMSIYRILSWLKFLRGTFFDIFGKTAERRVERQLLKDYEEDLELIISSLTSSNYSLSLDLASWPDSVRGFGHIKRASIEKVQDLRPALQRDFTSASRSVA